MTDPGIAATTRPSRVADPLLALGAGLAAFLAVVGPKVLDPGNMLWLTTQKDTFTHYLGWEFFRHAPAMWPPGLDPDYGLQFSSAILFSDSIPLIALPLKLVSGLLPEVFQYTGWWTLACFLLQAWFAVRIAGLFTRDAVVKLGTAGLLLFAPPFLWRLELHFSLIAHWIVLAAIYLCLAPPRFSRSWAWIALIAVSALVHTYLFAMILPVWFASFVRRGRWHEGALPWMAELVAGVAAALGALWLGGFFPLRSSLLTFGYGTFSLNLLSLINPNGTFTDPWSWSALLPMLPQGGGQYEGFAYLGLGAMIAVVLALPFIGRARATGTAGRIWPLVVAAGVLTLFAVSPLITIADLQMTVPVPEIIYTLAGSLRASGRFFWPVLYMIVIGAVWVLERRFGARAAGPLLLVLVAVQVWDTYPGWSAFAPKFAMTGATWPTSLDDPRLDAVAAHYAKVRALPATNQVPGWDQIAYFALRRGKPTDAVYLARPNDAAYAAYNATLDDRIVRDALDPDSLYVTDRATAGRIAAAMSADDALFRAGGFYVFAPGWSRFGATGTPPAVVNLWSLQ